MLKLFGPYQEHLGIFEKPLQFFEASLLYKKDNFSILFGEIFTLCLVFDGHNVV